MAAYTKSPVINQTLAIIFLLSFILSCSAAVERPRGVSLSKASLYKPDKHFRCLDGSATIPYEHVNDDYCDCQDGSDEPGTSACSNGHFHCTNAGHKPLNILSSRVNDGVCDCCDGTDEYSGVIECSNTCRELGRQAREDAERQQKLAQQGYEVRQEYIKQAEAAKAEKTQRLKELKAEKDGAESKMKEMEARKNEAETPEKEAKTKHEDAWKAVQKKKEEERESKKSLDAFKELDTNQDTRISVEEMQTHKEFDIDSDGTVSPEEAKEYLEDNDSVNFEFFNTKVWPNIKELYKKLEAPPSEEDANKQKEEIPPPSETPDDTPPVDDPAAEIDSLDEDDEHDDDHEQPRGEEAAPPASESSDDDKMPEYDEETKKLIDEADKARQNHKDAEEAFRNLESELSSIESFMNLDLGPNMDFYPLKGECYEMTDREYVYKLCPFEKTTQSSKSGGSETSLGNWGKWTGPDNNKYSKMLYEGGQGCWNGPDRTCKVNLICGTTNQLLSAAEPNRCEYEFTFQTPAVCEPVSPNKHKDPEHDEL